MKQFNKKLTRLVMLVSLVVIGQASVFAQLNGTYTVYGSGANYASLQAAASALSAGVSGPVTFKIRPGTWTDANTIIASIGNISGASATNTITFEAENGSASTTILNSSNTSTTAGVNNIFYLNGAKYIRIRNLTLNKSNASAGVCVRFAGDADYNIVENCTLTGAATTSSSTNIARVYGTSLASANGNIIRNNTIVEGTYSIYWYGSSSSSLSPDNEFSGNTFTNPYAYGFYSYYTSNLKFLNNTINRSINASVAFYGTYIYYADNAFGIDGNTVNMTGGTTTNYGMHVSTSDGTSTSRGSVSNNTVNISSSSTQYGISVQSSNYYSFNGNKVVATGTSTGTQYPLYNYNTSTTYGNQVYANNNDIAATGNGSMYVYGQYICTNGEFNNNKISLGTSSNSGSRYVYTGYQPSNGVISNGNDITMLSTNGSMYVYAMYTSITNGEFSNNKINIGPNTATGTSTLYLGYSTMNNVKINNNDISVMVLGSSTIYCLNSGITNSECKDNKMVMGTSTSTGARSVYMAYSGTDMLCSGNEVTEHSTNSTVALRSFYSSTTNGVFANNKVSLYAYGSTSTQYMYLGYSSNTNLSVTGNTLIMANTSSGAQYIYGFYSGNVGNVEYSGNTVNMSTVSGTMYHYGGYSNTSNTGYNKANNNNVTMTATSSASMYSYMGCYGYAANKLENEVIGNTVTMSSLGYSYNYLGYYNDGCTLTDNVCDIRSSYAAYGCYSYGYSSGTRPWLIKNNKVTAVGGGSTVMGLYYYYCADADIVNNVVYAKGTSTVYGLYGGYNKNGARIFNNSVYSESSSTNYTLYCYQYNTGEFAEIKNNVFARTGTTGYLMYIGQPSSSFYDMDYNNLYNNGTTMMYSGYSGATWANVNAMRTGLGWNMNSLSYNPGFYSTGSSAPDLRPDPANANSWSLNGRGVQLTGNDKDINGSPRALTTITGVPDIGAYEFVPTATPPNCTLTPAAPVANGTQVVTFGEDTVAVLKWGNTVPSGFAVRQYTGTNPPGITSINPTQMFYYAHFLGTGTNLDYQQDLYYKDPWLGTIASKSALRLAEKVGSNGWAGYSPSVSNSNVVRNFIHTPGVQDVGALFTGIDVSDNASADAIIEPVPPFCPGTYTVRLRIKNNGNNKINSVKVDWQKDGGAISTINYTTPIDINGSSVGNSAIITLGPVTFGKAAVNIKAWTYLPNGVQDPIPADDTLNQDYFAALSGTYTVGGTTPDFPTVLDAATILNQYGTCGNVIFDVRPGIYTGQIVLTSPVSASNTTDHVTFQSVNNDPSTTQVSYSATGSGDMPTVLMNGASNFTFRNMGIVAAGGSYGTGVEFVNKASNDSFLGCRIIVSTTASSNFRCVWNSGQADCNYNTFKDCSMEGGYYGIYWYTTTAPYSKGLTVDNCTMNPYYYGTYIYYSNELTARNNTITARQPGTSYYGLMAYMYNPNNANKTSEIYGNKIVGFYGYSMYLYYVDGTTGKRSKVMNNAVITADNTTCYYPMLLYYPTNCDVFNNTLINNGMSSTSYYGAYIYLSTYPNNKIYNNVFANRAGGYAASVTFSSGYGTEMDYNDLYSSSTSQMMTGNSTAADLATWRSGSGLDMHSVSYDPPFISNANPAPLTTDPGVWALNGHGVHITGNNKDINGNTRFEKRVDGVPDLGAYEIVPEVAPPAATANPAKADPGDTQVFTFAGNEVGRITWGLTAPSTAVTVRQYSGEKGNGIAAAASPMGSMYFHTDVAPVGNGTTFDFDFNLDYMDIWLGDIATEGNLRLAHRVTGYPWMVYSGSLSSVDTATNNVDASTMNRFGSYTALENGSIASAFVRAQGSVVICIGNSVVLNAEPQDGDNYKWYRNKVAIPGADGPNVKTYTATQPGDYSVVITFSGKSVESVPLTVTTIAPPNALISANGPLTYCTGNGLTLDAGNTSGVTYQWQLNGNDIPGATNSTYPVSQAGNYTVVVTNIGCSSTSIQTSVTSGPLVVDLGKDTSYCEIKNVWLKLDAGYPGAKYLWSTGDTTRTIEVKKGGKYTVQVDGGPNCVGQDDIQITIDPLPTANGISFVQNGNTYQFFPSGPVNAVGFMWLFSDGTVSTQTNPSKTISGDLYVRLVMFNACGSDTVQLGWPLSVQSVNSEDQLSVYPNPAKDHITVKMQAKAIETVEVLNSVGSVVYHSSANSNEYRIDISGLANGHYMLRAVTGDGIITKQFDVIK